MIRLLALFTLVAIVPSLGAQSPELTKAKAALATIDGTLTLPGLREPVDVRRDAWGVAHIDAKNTDDLFFAQGFVAAQDRLFQIDQWRRQGQGELAEVHGPSAVEADTFARLLKYRGNMDEEWAAYSPDAKAIATAFTNGINAAIDQFGDKLPIEFQLLGQKPARWKPEDVLGRMSGIYMSQNFRNEIERARLISAVGIEKVRWLAPVDPEVPYECHLGKEDLQAIGPKVLAGYAAATRTLQYTPPKTESNNWVVAGSRSASGKPMLASDPHRAMALPSLRYLVHLRAPGWNVIGAGEPGLPGVAIGHNDRVAWGFTIVGIDQADIYVEETNPANPNEYRADGKWKAMDVVKEHIPVKGEAAREVELRFTRHGPVIHTDAKRNRVYALKWIGSQPGGAAYLRSLSLGRANNRSEFVQALAGWKIPGLNFVYADVDGNVGWIAAGRTPVRVKHHGVLPVPGDGGFEWEKFLSIDEMPQNWAPADGTLATANHNILPKGYPHYIGCEFSAPYRFERIHEVLATREKWSLDGFQALQQDAVSIPARDLAALAQEASPYTALFFQTETKAPWDGNLAVDATRGPLYSLWLQEMKREFYIGRVPRELEATHASLGGLPTMLEALHAADRRWFGPDPKHARAEFMSRALTVAQKKLSELPKTRQERWGALHVAHFRHPFVKAFDLEPVGRPGDETTPNNTKSDAQFRQVHGASYRHVLDLADWDRGLATSTPGQSGQPGSPHYGDLLPLWAKGEYFPLAFSKAKVESVTRNRLTLKPAP